MRIRTTTAAGVLLAAAGLATRLPAQTSCRPVLDPAQMRVHGATLRMAPATYRVGTQTYRTNVYNGSFVAPTLLMKPGERMDLSVVNAMAATDSQTAADVAWTNQHYHGLVVTPRPDGGDNVTHVHIDRGAPPRPYDFLVPVYHNEGMFWYHPHPHGITNPQVAGGLSGALMIGSVLTYFPQYRGVRERTLLIRDMSFHFADQVLNVNGSTCALLPAAPGERQLWHIGNFNSNHFVNLKLRGLRWTLLALDGDPLARPETVDSLFIPPGTRAEVIVTAPDRPGNVELYTAPFLGGSGNTPTTLGFLAVSGPARPRPLRGIAGEDKAVVDTIHFLARATNVQRYTFRYSFPSDTTAAVNDTVYEPNHPPVSIPWGQVQEWTIVNETGALHTFHIHQTDFTIMSVNGEPRDERLLRDNVPLGVHRDSTGKLVGDTVVVRFTFEPIAAGPFVFHCHVLQHEDEGMMKNVCVYDPDDPEGVNRCNRMFSGGGGGHGGH
jgi:FtsP/CotA-like multicopper oxidase with cupredoxin domain